MLVHVHVVPTPNNSRLGRLYGLMRARFLADFQTAIEHCTDPPIFLAPQPPSQTPDHAQRVDCTLLVALDTCRTLAAVWEALETYDSLRWPPPIVVQYLSSDLSGVCHERVNTVLHGLNWEILLLAITQYDRQRAL